MTPPLPVIVLYTRPGCHLCDETRATLDLLIADRHARGLAAPAIEERDIESDDELLRRYAATIPVVALGDRTLELATSQAKLRRLLDEVLGEATAGEARTTA